MTTNQYVYIVDVYNPYARNENVIYRFIYHNQWWCVRRATLNWGIPQNTALEMDDEYSRFHLYNTYEEAMEFVKELRKSEGYDSN